MSTQRPYTAVLCNRTKTKCVEMIACVNWNEAKEEFTDANPGWNVVAVFAGSHLDRGRAYDQTGPPEKNKGSDRYIDPFDTKV